MTHYRSIHKKRLPDQATAIEECGEEVDIDMEGVLGESSVMRCIECNGFAGSEFNDVQEFKNHCRNVHSQQSLKSEASGEEVDKDMEGGLGESSKSPPSLYSRTRFVPTAY